MELLSHISALEYWRRVGTSGVATPRPTKMKAPPCAFSGTAAERLASQGVLTLPAHGLSSRKYHASSNRRKTRHFAAGELPSGSIHCIDDDLLVVSPELALLQVAPSVSFSELVALMSELCGLYSPSEFDDVGIVSRQQITTSQALQRYLERAHGLKGAKAARCASRYALDRARSPIEVALALLLTLPFKRGGFKLEGAQVNARYLLDAKARRAAGVQCLEPDILWPDAGVCIEYDSAEFHKAPGRIANDARRKNALVASGLTVITVTTAQLRNQSDIETLACHTALCLGRRVRPQSEAQRAAQMRLRRELLGRESILKSPYALSHRCGQVFFR